MEPNKNDLETIRTKPGETSDGKPFDFLVEERVKNHGWKLECVPAKELGTPRDLEIYRAKRSGNFIKDWENKAEDPAYCCEYWADLKIGEGACGYRCAACFLILTHRTKCDPSRHVVYENTGDFIAAARAWLLKANARQTLGLGVDCSDSLLYEGVTGYARTLIPLFADPATNPHGRRLLLLTKSANVHYLAGLPTTNTAISFSLNPQTIADLFEGYYPDGVRITPDIELRLEASKEARKMGFEVRWRIDPIIPVSGWEAIYADFMAKAASYPPHRITLGVYREMGGALQTMSRKWGLAPMKWQAETPLVKDGGTHYQIPEKIRTEIYTKMHAMIEAAWPDPANRPLVALCKEKGVVRTACGLTGAHCNCE